MRVATTEDVQKCEQLCVTVHGFARSAELTAAIAPLIALVVERAGHISAYSTGLGLHGYAVGENEDDLKALIGAAPALMGLGFFVPVRNGELFRWLLDGGFRSKLARDPDGERALSGTGRILAFYRI